MKNYIKNKKYRLVILSAVLLIAAAGLIGLNKPDDITIETTTVLQGEFVVDVEVSGELKAHQSRKIKGVKELGSKNKIAKIAPEADIVQEGDFLISFDTTDLKKKITDEEVNLDDKKKELIELIETQKKDSLKLERELLIQKLNFDQYQLEYELTKFLPDNEKRAAEIEMKKKELDYYDKIDEIESKKLEYKDKISRKITEIGKIEDKILKYNDDLNKSTIYAPITGLVLYQEVSAGLGVKEKIRVGSEVSYSYTLIELPDLSTMCIKTSITEMDISMVKVGQEVIVNLDRDDSKYTGRVIDVAQMERVTYIYSPTGERKMTSVYDVEIEILDKNEGKLKPGMKVTCNIITNKLEDKIYVTFSAVFDMEDKIYVFVKKDGDFIKTPVTLGLKNREYVVIENGLVAGQEIALENPFSLPQDKEKNSNRVDVDLKNN
ncbi:efflux RND transporter periplasmic adaptor subunit [candidate division KSB1 bacterium]